MTMGLGRRTGCVGVLGGRDGCAVLCGVHVSFVSQGQAAQESVRGEYCNTATAVKLCRQPSSFVFLQIVVKMGLPVERTERCLLESFMVCCTVCITSNEWLRNQFIDRKLGVCALSLCLSVFQTIGSRCDFRRQ